MLTEMEHELDSLIKLSIIYKIVNMGFLHYTHFFFSPLKSPVGFPR